MTPGRVSPPGYLLGLLMCVLAVHGIDRMGFSIVLDSIKGALSLNDTQLGLLAGPAFALLNAAAAIPLAHLADRFGRKMILSVCILAWSGFTAVSGLAINFAGLAAARACVGFADAAASPVSQSLVVSGYPEAKRAGGLGLLFSGSYLGSVLGFAGAGIIAEKFGWRAALIWMGVPGLILGVVIWLTLEEPREARDTARETSRSFAAWLRDWARVLRQAIFLDAAMTVASGAILGWALVAWLPSFFQRSYGMGPEETGLWLAGAMGAGAATGVWLGGAAASWLHARSQAGGLWLGFWTTLLSAPVLTVSFVTHSKALSLGCVITSSIAGAFCLAPVYAVIQDLADRRARATIAAIFGVVNTLLGQAGGPLLVGAISDLTKDRAGSESLRLSLEIVSLLGFWPAIHLYRLAKRRARC